MTIALGHKRNDTIDVFRAVAILAVMAYHYGAFAAERVRLSATSVSWIELGRFGVHIFFIVSGMVIAMTLSRSSSFGEFAVKRAARIYPAYLVAMVLTFAVTRVLPIDRFWASKFDLVRNLSPYAFGQLQVDPSYWSLTYEIQFYVLAGALYAWLGGRAWAGLAVVTVIGAMAALLSPGIASGHLLLVYMPLFLAGVGAWTVAAERRREGWIALAIALACYFATAPLLDDRPHTYNPLMMHGFILGLGGLLIALVVMGVNLRLPGLPAIGRFSYSLYLVHQVIGISLIFALTAHGVSLALAIGIATSIVMSLAYLNFRMIEERGRALILKAYAVF